MSIRFKFVFFILAIAAAFITAGAAYYLLTIPEGILKSEQEKFEDVRSAIYQISIDISQIESRDIQYQQQVIEHQKEILDAAYEELNNLQLLPTLSDKIRTSLVYIQEEKQAFEDDWERYNLLIADLTELIETIFPPDADRAKISCLDFFTNEEVRNHPDILKAQWQVEQLNSWTFIMNNQMKSARGLIEKQSEVITGEIKRISKRAYLILTSVAVIIIFVSLFSALIFANRMARRISVIEQAILKMSEGDLTVRPSVPTRDELGHLCRHLRNFTETLSASFHIIQGSSAENLEVEQELLNATDHTRSMVQAIQSSSASIRERSQQLESEIQTGFNEVKNTVGYVHSVEDRLHEQSAMVVESTSAVTQMITSIGNVTEITSHKREATESLITSAHAGEEKLSTTLAVITDMQNSIDEVSAAVRIIQNVAAKTNLLSMNAAIEAAHAGEAGRGFSVVAEEIRKLAETTAVNSRRIAGVVREVVEKIETSAAAGIDTKQAFELITAEITGVTESFQEISASMTQLQGSGTQILESMQQLQDTTLDIKTRSAEMTEASRNTGRTMEAIHSISEDFLQSIGRIQDGIDGIDTAVGHTHSLATRINGVTENLDRQCGLFRTEIVLSPGFAPDSADIPDSLNQPVLREEDRQTYV